MQDVAGYDAGADSLEPTVSVLVNGVEREIHAFSLNSELPSFLPSAVAGGSGSPAMTGNVIWADSEDSSSKPSLPWSSSAWPPRQWDIVTLDAGYSGSNARLLTGTIDGARGNLSSAITSNLVDNIDVLEVPITIEPLLSTMPPLGDTAGEFPYRHIGLTATYFTDRLCRAAGLNSTPPRGANCVVSAPLMGSSWPEAGTLYRSTDTTFAGSPSWFDAPWGQAAYSLDAAYYPFLSAVSGKLDQTLQITAMAGPNVYGPDPATVSVNWDVSNYIRLRVMNNRAVYAQVMAGGTFKDVCSIPASAAATATTFMLRCNTGGGVSIYADNGATAAGSFTPSAVMTGTALADVSVFVPRASSYILGGVQVAFNSVPTYQYTRNAFLSVAAYRQQLEASPYIENRTVRSLIEEQADGERAGWGFDSYGNFWWKNRDILVGAGSVETLTLDQNIEDLDWENTHASVHSRVEVTSRQAGISIGQTFHKSGYQGSGVELGAGETHTEFITPPSGVDWITVDETMRAITEPGASTMFNLGYGSFVGVTAVFTEGLDEGKEANTGQYSFTFERITPQTWKFWIQMGSALTSDINVLRTPGDGFTTAFWPGRRAFKLPVVRPKAVNEWQDITTVGAHVGPVGAPVYVHDVGWWVQNPIELQRIADELSFILTKPAPVIRSLQVVPDDRRERGDIITVQLDNATLRCIIIGKNDEYSTDPVTKTQTLKLFVLSVVSTGTTYDVFDEVYGSYSYNQFDTAWSAETYNTLDSDPLRKA